MTPSVYPPPSFPAEGFLFSCQTAPQGGASRRAGPPGRPRSCRCGPCGARLASLASAPLLPRLCFAPAFSLPAPCGGAARLLRRRPRRLLRGRRGAGLRPARLRRPAPCTSPCIPSSKKSYPRARIARPYPHARPRAIRNFPRKFLLAFRRNFPPFAMPILHPVH